MRLVTALLILLVGSSAATAQTDRPVQLTFDYSTFAYDETESLVDLYMAFEAASLPFVQADGGFIASVPIYLRMAPASVVVPGALEPETVWADSSELRFAIRDTLTIAQGQQFVHLDRALVPPGEYAVEVRVPASGRTPELRVVSEVRVPSYAETRVRLSDLLLASRIAPGAAPDDPFYRNGLSVQPNATALFGEGLSTLYYYAEAYNATGAADGAGTYQTNLFIAKANTSTPISGLEKRQSREARPVDVLVGSFDLSQLPTGSYLLRAHVIDPGGSVIAERNRKFFHYNPSVQTETPETAPEQTFETSAFAMLTDEEAETMMEQITIILTDSEKRRASSLPTADAKRRFLRDAWAVRDPNPNTSVNEFKVEYDTRIQFANDRFGSNRGEGWKSDRGRVLLRYGIPPEIEPHLFDQGVEPHEIWTYTNIPGEGQSIFVFADPRGFGDFRLLHSSVRNERSNPGWRQELAR